MKVTKNFTTPIISDKDLAKWYGLDISEVKQFKQQSGYSFMKKEIETVSNAKYLEDSADLIEYMEIVFVIKKHLELFLSETKRMDLS